MTKGEQATASWEKSALPREIARLAGTPRTVAQLADELGITDEYFASGRVDRAATPKYGFHWVLTPTDLHPLDDE
jgi:hypothetical protein